MLITCENIIILSDVFVLAFRDTRGKYSLIFSRTFDVKLIKKRTVTKCATINIELYLDLKKDLQQCVHLQSGRMLEQEKKPHFTKCYEA